VRWLRRLIGIEGPLPKRCSSNTGLIWGYRCTLNRGHEGQHKALISTTVTSGLETSRTEAIWD
jgi:hypothetical protein